MNKVACFHFTPITCKMCHEHFVGAIKNMKMVNVYWIAGRKLKLIIKHTGWTIWNDPDHDHKKHLELTSTCCPFISSLSATDKKSLTRDQGFCEGSRTWRLMSLYLIPTTLTKMNCFVANYLRASYAPHSHLGAWPHDSRDEKYCRMARSASHTPVP